MSIELKDRRRATIPRLPQKPPPVNIQLLHINANIYIFRISDVMNGLRYELSLRRPETYSSSLELHVYYFHSHIRRVYLSQKINRCYQIQWGYLSGTCRSSDMLEILLSNLLYIK